MVACCQLRRCALLTANPSGSSASILIVGDRADDRRYLAALFGYQGYVVYEAADALQALDLIGQHHPDLVISGARVPPVGGLEFVRRVRAMHGTGDTPVAFYTTAFYEHETRAVAELCGVDDILTRSATPDILVDRVHALIAEGREPGPARVRPPSSGDVSLQPSGQLVAMVQELAAAEQQMEATLDVCQRLASDQDAASLLHTIAEGVRRLTHASVAVAGLFDDEGRDGGAREASGAAASLAAVLRGAPLADSFRGSMLQGATLRWVAGDEHGGAFAVAINGFAGGSGVAVPMTTRGRVRGWVVAFNRADLSPFTDRDERAAAIIGAQAGAALERAEVLAAAQQAVDRLRTDAEHTTFALEAGRMGVWTWELPSGLLHGSDALAFIMGLASPDALRNLPMWLDLVEPDDRERVAEAFRQSAADLSGLNVEYRIRRADGSIRLQHVLGRVSINAEGRAVRMHGVVTDVTDRRMLEAQLRQAQRIETVGLLAGGVAHDFNNMLTAILGYSRLAEDQLPPGAGPRREIEEINKAAERASLLTRQLLAFSRQQVLEPMALDVNAIIEDLTGMLRRLIGEQIQVRLSLDADLPRIRGDRSQIEQVVMNLVVNARDAMPGGGRLEIASSVLTLSADDSVHGVVPVPGVYVVLAVSDTGSGVPEDLRPRIFEPFFTTKEHGRGTGLGLATVRGVVEQCGGYVDVVSEVGQGSTFLAYFPALPSSEGARRAAPPSTRVAGGSERVLVVEDEPEIRRLVRTILERAGYQVSEAAGIRDAEAVIAGREDGIDLLVADIFMPDGSGPELYNRLLSVRPSIRGIFMSGYSDEHVVADAISQPGVAFLQKPFTVDALVRKAREVLDR